MTNRIKTCKFNIDTACAEVKLTDGSMESIDCDAVKDEYARNMYETSELDFLIYNEPMSYVKLKLRHVHLFLLFAICILLVKCYNVLEKYRILLHGG